MLQHLKRKTQHGILNCMQSIDTKTYSVAWQLLTFRRVSLNPCWLFAKFHNIAEPTRFANLLKMERAKCLNKPQPQCAGFGFSQCECDPRSQGGPPAHHWIAHSRRYLLQLLPSRARMEIRMCFASLSLWSSSAVKWKLFPSLIRVWRWQ